MFLAFKRDYLDIDTSSCCLPNTLSRHTWTHVEIVLPINCMIQKCPWCEAPGEQQPASDYKHYVTVTVDSRQPTTFIIRSDKHLNPNRRAIWHYIYIPLDENQYTKACDFIQTQIGKPFPCTGRIHYWWYWFRHCLPMNNTDVELLHNKTWICAELATACLIYCGYRAYFVHVAPRFTTPCDLYTIAGSLPGALVQKQMAYPNRPPAVTLIREYKLEVPPLTCKQKCLLCLYRLSCARLWFSACRRRRLYRTVSVIQK